MSTQLVDNATPQAMPSADAHFVTERECAVQIPVMSRQVKPNPRLLLAHDSKDPRAEKIRTLRTELLLRRAEAEQTGVIALISPGPGEGRTQLAAELAISFAQLGRSTLLVDADLRRPQLHLLFDAHNGPGLAQALERGISPHLFAVAGFSQFYLLTAGSTPANPAELLSHERFAFMMDNWRQTFDFVVIDTSPMTLYADGLVVASVAGRVLPVSRANHTPYKEMQNMLRRLTASRSEVVGAVISHF
jgi:protein-tyrosine kinase